MKIFLKMKTANQDNVLERTIRLIIPHYGHQLVDAEEEAELVMTNIPEFALSTLNDYEEMQVAMLIIPGERHVKMAANSLVKNFPQRVENCHVISFAPEDKELNIYLIEKGGMKNEDTSRG